MKVDGYTPIDTDQAREFEYRLEYGVISVTSRMADARHNKQFAAALKDHQDWVDREEQFGGGDDVEIAKRFLGVLYDHVVVSWTTTIKSGGKKITSKRENFVALLSTPACDKAAMQFFKDISEERNFRAKTVEEDAKN